MEAEKIMKRTGNSKIAVVGWGRGMGHTGHMYLADAVIEQAKAMNADPYFFVSKTVGKDDPIYPEEKVQIYQTVFPKYTSIFIPQGNLNQALTDLSQMGYDGVVVVVGADQKQAFQYLEKPNKEGVPVYQSMGFKKLKVISRQETRSKYAKEEGPRATPMREILMNPNATEQDKFAVWRRDMPKSLSDEQVLDLMQKAEQRMRAISTKAKKLKEFITRIRPLLKEADNEKKLRVLRLIKEAMTKEDTKNLGYHTQEDEQDVAEGKKKRKKKASKQLRGYFFPGYGYYGFAGSGEYGGDGGGESIEEGDVLPFKKPQALTWQQLPNDVLKLANDWYWASEDNSGLDAVLDPKGYGSGTRNELQYITAKLQQRGWSIDFNDEHDKPGEFNLILKNKNGQSILLSIEDAHDFKGWAQGTNSDLREEQNPLVDLTPNFPNYSKLIGEFVGTQNNKIALKIVSAELKPGAKETEKIARAIATNKPIAMAPNYVRNRTVVGEEDPNNPLSVEEAKVLFTNPNSKVNIYYNRDKNTKFAGKPVLVGKQIPYSKIDAFIDMVVSRYQVSPSELFWSDALTDKTDAHTIKESVDYLEEK